MPLALFIESHLCGSNPSLRVAYIDEREERQNEKPSKVYYSVLVKAINGLDQEIYRIKLPGPVRLGEGKPENQNHAVIFTRGEGLQTIDMNQVSIHFQIVVCNPYACVVLTIVCLNSLVICS